MQVPTTTSDNADREEAMILEKARALVREARDRARRAYGREIGRGVDEVVTPALILDLPGARRNIEHMAAEMSRLPAGLRPHIKVHKSPDLARIQAEHGIMGLSVATVWEAAVMAGEGFSDIFVVNTVTGPAQMRVLIELALHSHLMVAVDDASNAGLLSSMAVRAGVTLGVVLEIDTGMDRAGVDTGEDALALARQLTVLPGLRFEGLTGYEGHCSGVVDDDKRLLLHQKAMDFFAGVAERLIGDGIPVGVRSAGGTSTWKWTASYPGITDIQAGSYVVMDNFHGRMVHDFEKALTIATTVISRPHDRVVVDVGNKTVAVPLLASVRDLELKTIRFDEEHGVFEAGPTPPGLGARLQIIPGYAPTTINAFEAFHVVEGGVVIDTWPVVPRGPGHHGLGDLLA
jgi:D-serine deaminase-like pyridoxal phosphate-dependent protein